MAGHEAGSHSADDEVLGHVRFPSGDVVLIDFGLLHLWSGGDPPAAAPEDASSGLSEQTHAEADFELGGPDAAAVAADLDLAVLKGRYAFDLPFDGGLLPELVDQARRQGAGVELRRLERTPHRERVRLLLSESPGGAEVPFPGGWAVAVRGLPRDRSLRVLGRRMPSDGPDDGRWHSVWVEVSPAQVVHSTPAGHVLVDEARLLWADQDALSSFRTGESDKR